MPEKFQFIVTVETDKYSDAEQVLSERLSYDEDYGFPYTVDWRDIGSDDRLAAEQD